MNTFTSKSNGTNSIEDKLDGAREHLKNKTDEYLSKGMAGAESVRDSMNDAAGRLTHNLGESLDSSWKTVRQSSKNVQSFVKKYPVYTAVGAVAISFLVGAMYGKSSCRK